MSEPPSTAPGERLVGDAYVADFYEHFWRSGPSGFWKLERLQTFQEPSDESWVAFAQGDWEKALHLLEARRPSVESYFRKIAEGGFSTWRVRVVEQPITPYLQWEMHLLRMWAQCGENVRVVAPGEIERFESNRLLPEIVTLGAEVMYELDYDVDGLQRGGIRITSRDAVVRWRKFIEQLFARGEELELFFEREVAALEPPQRV